ncbi:MAG: cobalamin-dependent protein [Nitrospirae bacterium]|nr:cobalamin-dependent protein [Nitrospirota bacterium]MBF0553295.1 cobalamin-dependent protein [Nitrospirota bacterium]
MKARRILSETINLITFDQLIETVIVSALENIGKGWEKGEYALSQVYMSGRICEELVETLIPMGNRQKKPAPKMAIAMLNDYHALGKRIVYSTLRASGFDVLDYGRVSTEGLVQRICDDGIEVILISVLMFPSALHVKDVKDTLGKKVSNVKIVVGGAPFRLDRQLWKQVGADAVGYTASDAIDIIQSIAAGGS